MDFDSYGSFWDHQASTPQGAMAAVDGSGDEAIVRRTGAWTAAQVRHALQLKPTDDVFELGCGIGRVGRELLDHCRSWTGADISRHMLDVAQDRLAEFNKVRLIELSRTALDAVADQSMDKAYCVAVFCHLDKEDVFLYLEEMKRILRPGGLLLIETWNLGSPVGWKRWELEVRNWSVSDQSVRKNIARNQFCHPDELSLYVEKAGLDQLIRLDDSPWLQIIATTGQSESEMDATRKQLRSDIEHIAYSESWTHLFDATLDVKHGSLHPADLLKEIDELGDTIAAVMYRDYVLGLWRQDTKRWGPAPD